MYPYRQPTVREIEKAVSRAADEFGYGNVWLFGNYYEGIYNEGCPIQVMLDSSETPRSPMAFADTCYRATGLQTAVYLTDHNAKRTAYVMTHSRLVHHARTPPA